VDPSDWPSLTDELSVASDLFGDVDELCDCVSAEWSMFAPGFLRLRARPGRIIGPNTVLDMTIHAARRGDTTAPDGRVELRPFDDVEEAIAIVDRRYERLAIEDPELARNVSPACAPRMFGFGTKPTSFGRS
jgi:hypothetical protein